MLPFSSRRSSRLLVVAESLILICASSICLWKSTVGLAPMVAAWLMIKDRSIGGSGSASTDTRASSFWLSGSLSDFVNGLLVVKLKLNAFITTLAILILLRGVRVSHIATAKPCSICRVPSLSWHGEMARDSRLDLDQLIAGLFMRYPHWPRDLRDSGAMPRPRASPAFSHSRHDRRLCAPPSSPGFPD